MTKFNTRKIVLFILFILILLIIALLVGGITYSYLSPTMDDDISLKGEITASGDTIMFSSGNTLSLSATTDNFTTGGSNLSSTTNPKAKIVASSKTNEASSSYYIGVDINNNTYTYSTSSKSPEIILTIQDENDNNVTEVDGLSYVTQGEVSGFDITNKFGLFDIKIDYPISTKSSTNGTTRIWTFTLTFINLDSDQSVNENGKMNIDIYFMKEKSFPSRLSTCNDNTLACYIAKQYNEEQGNNNIYYHDLTLKNGARDESYRYAGTSESTNNFVCFGIDEETCLDDNLYRIVGVFDDKVKLIKWDYATSELLGTDGDYYGIYNYTSTYYKGSNGLENIAAFSWNRTNYKISYNVSGDGNDWSYSELNKTNLNKNFIDSLGDYWVSKIAITKWKVGGNANKNIVLENVYNVYKNEINNPELNQFIEKYYNAKIGLIELFGN